ncbi:UDP-N-acetylmuramate dehydrogenase [Celeribacter neptunius]|uniref:UDP-N-acetylenolpyruvoylglucosamine reductase n=2 Tax=Celeribacter neptunius TaxID=588602 RepID=A0A1I3VJY5_9RHOB|nr:UDP-N-acetylmuramate dehydrogenase [Celeribacter neptunius]
MRLTEYFDLSHRNSFGFSSRARYGAEVTRAEDIRDLARLSKRLNLPLHLLGSASNCLLPDRLHAVVGVMAIKGWSVDDSPGDHVRVTAQAGEDWSDLVARLTARDIGGLENLAGIPGTVGAAPVQNIGAYGMELSDVFESLQAYDRRADSMITLGKADCRFGYRHSLFKDAPGRYLITQVTLRLPRPWHPVLSYVGLRDLPAPQTPETILEAVLAQRAAKLPDWRVLGNVGSFFHNPIVTQETLRSLPEMPAHPTPDGVKLSAAWLIDHCGLKGLRIGDAGIHTGHALIIVNHGRATLPEVQALADQVIRRVRAKFGVTLVPEPVTLG